MSPVAVSERALERIRGAHTPCRSRSTCWRWSATGSTRPARLSPHGADPPHLRAARGAAPGARRGAGRRAGAGTPEPGASCRTRSRVRAPRAAGRSAPPAGAADRRPRARGGRRQGRCSGGCCTSTGSRSAAGSAGAPPIWRIGLMGVNAAGDRRARARRAGRCFGSGACVRRQRVERRAYEEGRGVAATPGDASMHDVKNPGPGSGFSRSARWRALPEHTRRRGGEVFHVLLPQQAIPATGPARRLDGHAVTGRRSTATVVAATLAAKFPPVSRA